MKTICTRKFIMPVPGAASLVFRPGQSLDGNAAAFAIAHGFAYTPPAPLAPVEAPPTLAAVTIIHEDGSEEPLDDIAED